MLEAVVDDGAMANALDEDAYQAVRKRIGELEWSGRVLRMADGRIVPSRGRWSGSVTFGGVMRHGQFEVFPSGGAWTVLFGKPLLEDFGAWHGYEEDVIVLRDEGRTVRVHNKRLRDHGPNANNAALLMTMRAGPATRATITGGSSAPPARQAPFPAPSTSVEQVDQQEFPQPSPPTDRDAASDSDWWRAPSPVLDRMRKDAAGGRDTPPTRQVQIPLVVRIEDADEHSTDTTEYAETRQGLADESVHGAAPRVRLTRSRVGRRERERARSCKHELQTGVNKNTPARQVHSAPAVFPISLDNTPQTDNKQPRLTSSTQRRLAIAERRLRKQREMEVLASTEMAEATKKAVNAQAMLKAMVGEAGVVRERFSREERCAWRKMKAMGKGGNDHVARHARNSEGNSRFPSREVPPHIDSVQVRVTDTDGSRKPRRPDERGGKWPVWLVTQLEPTAPRAQHLGGSSRSPLRGVKFSWRAKPHPYIDAHIDSRLPHLRDGVPNLGEPEPSWADIWHVDDVGDDSGGDPGFEQPEAAGGVDKTLFTRKTNPRNARRMAEVKRRITVGKDLSQAEREQVDALLDEFVNVFGLSMSEVYAVPGAEHKLNIPAGSTFKSKVNQRPLSPPQRVFFNKVLDEMLEAEVIRPINPADVKCCGATTLAQKAHNGGGLSIEELQRRVDDQCIASGFESAFHTGVGPSRVGRRDVVAVLGTVNFGFSLVHTLPPTPHLQFCVV
ncbi:hypothetical protein C8R46DRAFT_1237350 [Mycena filopes]|nr:hypothetical protein C8R46DRAFT_1237350 [Mycena filopes]